jgi:flagellar hook protein FlgE
MSIYGSMFAGVSGLKANSQAMGMISDNIANLNTIGYKHTNARFSTLVTNAGSETNYALGGVVSAPFQLVDRQGLLQASSNQTDLAISGQGFFVVNDGTTSGAGRFLYTRAGEFSVDSNGYLVNNGGYYLQGWPTLPDGSFDVDLDGVADPSVPDPTSLSYLQPIQVSSLTGTATPTASVSLALNLPATAAVSDTQSMTTLVYDSLGVGHNVALQWTKSVAAPATWTLEATGITRADNGAASTQGATLASFPLLLDTVVFNGDGTPASFSPTALAIPTADWTTAASSSSISFGLGTANQADGITQFASSYTISSINQDGVTFGRFQSTKVSDDGLVTALFDNGGRRAIYKLPIATFSNPSALKGETGNAWSETVAAGNVFLNPAGTASAGLVSPSSLESSTVDLGEEFTKMIITQRAYSANTRTITTADQMLEELVRLKR